MCKLCTQSGETTESRLARHAHIDLDKKQEEMKARNTAVKKTGYTPQRPFMASAEVDSEVRRERLKYLRGLMGKTKEQFSAMLGTSLGNYKMMEYGRRPIIHAYSLLAEYLYKEWLEQKSKRVPEPPHMPDAYIRSQVFVLDAAGKSHADICRELVLRPEVVDYLLNNTED